MNKWLTVCEREIKVWGSVEEEERKVETKVDDGDVCRKNSHKSINPSNPSENFSLDCEKLDSGGRGLV